MSNYAVAYHESGHAIVGRLLGYPASEAVAFSSGDGYAMIFQPRRYETKQQVADSIMIYLAGSEAESLFLGELFVPSKGLDHRRVQQLRIAHGLIDHDVEALRQKTRDMLAYNWRLVRAVVVKLARKVFISGRQIDSLIARKLAMLQEGD